MAQMNDVLRLRVPSWLLSALDEMASRQAQTRSAFVRRVLVEAVNETSDPGRDAGTNGKTRQKETARRDV